MEEKVRISDIARRSGVSPATVSHALNNKAGVSEETRLRILRIAEELEYPIKASPSPVTSRRLATIGMLVKTDAVPPQANPFYSKVIMGIEDVCRRNGISLLFASVPVDENNQPIEIPQMFYSEKMDGILMVGTYVDDTLASISGRRVPPVVLVDGYSRDDDYDSVVSDNFRAAYTAVEHLIQKGHRHIALVGSEMNSYPSLKERRNGYQLALNEHEITDTYYANFNVNKSRGYQETGSLIKEHPQITALFCVNDSIAAAAMRAIHDMGKRVPADVSIIGYDDTYIGANAQPAITTMRVDTITMGRAAVNLLSMRLENPESACMTLIINPKLIERETVSSGPSAAPPGGHPRRS